MKDLIIRMAGWAAGWLPPGVVHEIYRFKPFASLIRKILNRAVPAGLTRVKVAGGELAGIQMILDLQSEKDYWLGSYEPRLQAAVCDWVKPGMVVYDLGANIGYISLLMARQVGEAGKVFAFEALPANLERMQLNLSDHKPGMRITIVSAAVIDGDHPVRFLVGPSGGMGKVDGSAGRQDFSYRESIDVLGISLDHFVFGQGNPPPGLVKMDIEGGEVLALPGMRKVLRQVKPVIFIELHGPEAAGAAWEELTCAGYRICQMQSGYPPVKHPDELEWKSYIVAYCDKNL